MKKSLIVFIALVSSSLSVFANDNLPGLSGSESSIAIEQLSQFIRWGGVLSSLIIIILVWLLLRFVHRVVENISNQFVQKRLLLQKIETVVQFFVYISTGLLVITLSLKLDDRVLALIGGTLAVAVGFALKDLVASFIAGLMIMIDRPFQVGDRLSFEGVYGDVLSIGLRSVRVQTLDDDVVTIPNNKFLNEVSQSGNYGALDMHVGMDFYIAYDQDVELARDIIAEAAASSRYVHLPRPIVVLVSQQLMDNYIAVKLRLKAYVLDTRYEKLFESDVNLRVIREFNAREIQPAAVLHRYMNAPQPQVEKAPAN